MAEGVNLKVDSLLLGCFFSFSCAVELLVLGASSQGIITLMIQRYDSSIIH